MDTGITYRDIGLSILFSRHILPLKRPIYKFHGNITSNVKANSPKQKLKKHPECTDTIIQITLSVIRNTDHSNNFQNLRDDVLIFWNTQKILNKLILVNTEMFLALFSKQWKIYFQIFKATLSPTDNATSRQIFSLTEKVRFLLY